MNSRSWIISLIVLVSLAISCLAVSPAWSAPKKQDYQCGNRAFNVPDDTPWYRFHQACVWHDTCYSSRGYGGQKKKRYPKSWCDGAFRFLMERSCQKNNPGKGCMRAAWTYYQAVRWFAHGAYNGEKNLEYRCIPDPRQMA